MCVCVTDRRRQREGESQFAVLSRELVKATWVLKAFSAELPSVGRISGLGGQWG